MASSFHLQTLKSPLLQKSHFLVDPTNFTNSTQKSSLTVPKPKFKNVLITAKFNIYEMMGGRGLCNGEEGLQQELKKSISKEEASKIPNISSEKEEEKPEDLNMSEDAFEKELLGLTGGFPGGELGLKKFIDQNPSPKK